jgi:hypothetical protein
VRNDHYKVVTNFNQAYDATSNSCVPTTTDEFYAIDQRVPIPLLDEADDDLLQNPPLTPKEKLNYVELKAQMTAILNSQPPCPGDGNIDGVVNADDLVDFNTYKTITEGKSSWYDFNLDGLTNLRDQAVVEQNLGKKCKK